MTSEAALASAVQAVAGRTVWRAWQGAGSHLFFELGEPKPWVSDRTSSRDLNGVAVEQRRASVWGSHCIHIEMAEWQAFSRDSLIADSEASDDVFRRVLGWLEGQHLVELLREGPTVVSLRFDLGARFELTCLPDPEADDTLLSIKHGEEVTILRADGSVVVEPWPEQQDP